jgi:hypothetical protein
MKAFKKALKIIAGKVFLRFVLPLIVVTADTLSRDKFKIPIINEVRPEVIEEY